VSHKTKVQHSVNNKPRAPLTGLRDPIIKRGRERESDEKKSKKTYASIVRSPEYL